MKTAIRLLCCLALFSNGCGSNSGGSQSAAPPSATPLSAAPAPTASPSNAATVSSMASPASSPTVTAGALDVCSLIDKSEIATVQGAQVQSTTPSNQVNGAIAISQCYYTVTSTEGAKNLSVHLQVMKADPKDPGAVTAYWEKAFHEKKGKKKKGPPQAVAGVGEEAFWIDSGKTGVLYALQKKSLVRVSIGGQDSKNRLEKSKQLIAKALERVS